MTQLNGSETSVVGSGPLVLADTWYVLEANFDGTHWSFFVNGTSIGTVSTTLPTTQTLAPICKLRKAATGAAVIRSYQIDEYATRYDLATVGPSIDTLDALPSISPQPTADQVDCVPVVRVIGGLTAFDYLRCDDVEFGDAGVPVGRYLAAASNDLKTAIQLALAVNPSKYLFVLPPGVWSMSSMSESSGLRNNLVFDGIDPMRCTLQRTTQGSKFVWNNSASNVVFRNITFDVSGVSTPFSSSIAVGAMATRFLYDNCHFFCTIPDVSGGPNDDDGIRHQLVHAGSTDVVVRRCYFKSSQCKMASGGVNGNADGVLVYGNRFEDCNDLGVSCVSGDASNCYVKNVQIYGNRFFGTLKGAGFIYVGSDAATLNPDLVSDIIIANNVCVGSIGKLGSNASRPNSRFGIYCVLGDVNRRVKILNNLIATDNPSFSTPQVTAIGVFLRNGTSTSSDDITIDGNSTDFRSDDARAGILVDAPNLSALGIYRNRMAAGTRGLVVGACSDSDIENNVVDATTSCALLLDSTRNAISDVRVRRNKLNAAGSFKSTIQFAGNHNMTRIAIEQNRLLTANGNSAVNGLTGGSTLDLAYNYNSHNVGLHGTVTPGQNVGNRLE